MTKKLPWKKKHGIWCLDTTSCIRDKISSVGGQGGHFGALIVTDKISSSF